METNTYELFTYARHGSLKTLLVKREALEEIGGTFYEAVKWFIARSDEIINLDHESTVEIESYCYLPDTLEGE